MNKQELLKIIEKVAKHGMTRLSLKNNRLTSLPREIAQLTNLVELSLRNNQLTNLPREIAQLTNLELLSLSNNRLTSLPREIAQLTNLEVLSLSNNQLTNLPGEIAQLTNLKRLSLHDNQLTSLPREIAQLTNLTELSLHDNQLTSLPREIAQLTNLEVLYLSDNQLTSLPREIGQLTNLTWLSLDHNPLTSPPPEIVQQGTQAILAYLRQQMEGSQRQWVSKLLVVGEGGVGKTSLLRALRKEAFDTQESTTHGIEIRSLELAHPTEANVTMHLNTWDFGGQEIYHATHQFFLTNRSLFLLAWNARLGFEQGKLYYWLDTIQALAPESPVLLVATHIDSRKPDLPLAELKAKYPQILGHCEISNRLGIGIPTLREEIAEAAAKLPLMGETWPTTWLNAANTIRSQPEKHITPEELQKLMLEQQVSSSDAAILARWLHELGEILYFQSNDQLNDIIILKPQWVTEYISKVLESEEVIRESGIFTREHMDSLWCDIPRFMRSHFLRLMECFDLSYQTQANQEISLIVERLPLDPPDFPQKWQQIRETDNCKEISIKFKLNTIPAGIPTWFIARAHRFTTHTHWRNGAIFAYGSNPQHLALVQAFPHDRYLQLTVRGQNPQNFFALLKDGIELILERFPGLKISRTIPCPCNKNQPCSHEFEYEHLLNRKKPTIECPVSEEDLSVAELLFGLEYSTQNIVLSRLDEVIQRQDQTLEKLSNLLELTQRGFTNDFRREQASIDSQCPNVFALRPRDLSSWRQNILGQKIDLQLYCQKPGCWHPTVEGGKYEIDEPAQWLIEMAPYVRGLVGVLKYASPLVGPWLGVAIPDDYEKLFKNDIELMDKLVTKLPEIEAESQLPSNVEKIFPVEHLEGSALRALRHLLEEKDPQQKWGGLKLTVTPEGHYLWLCEYHAAEYK
ncbi:MAG: COR domain-containing protein [Potamolinea sp.]